MNLPGFIGCSYRSLAPEVNCEDAVNLQPEATEVPDSKAPVVLYGSPGTRLYATVGTGPIRAMIDTEGFTDVISGGEYYRINPSGAATLVGTVANDGRPARIVASVTQVLIVSAGVAYYSDGSGFAAVPSPPWATAADCAYLDGLFVVLDDTGQPVGGQFFITDDATTWDPLDFSTAPSSNNKLRALATDHDELWIFGTVVTQVFFFSNNADFPFQLNSTATVQQGTEAKASVQQLDNTLLWLGHNQSGGLQAFAADGYRPQRISTHAVEQQWAQYAEVTNVVAYSYQMNGHPIYHLNFITAQKSWRYDRSTNLWHRVMFRNPMTNAEECHRGNTHCFRLDKHIVGDRQTGQLWEMSPQIYADGDNELLAYRIAPAPFQGNKVVFYNIFELITPAGIGDGSELGPDETPEANPAWMLSWSNDSGHTFGQEFLLRAGSQSDFTKRLRKVRCGSARNRVFKVAISAAVPRCLIGAEIEMEVGTS